MFGHNEFVWTPLRAENIIAFQRQGTGQGGGQGGGGDGGANSSSCFSLPATAFSSLSKKYTSPNGGYWLYQYANYNNNKFYIVSWDSPSAPTTLQISNFIKSLRGVGANAGASCINPSNPGFTQVFEGDRFNTSLNNNKWEEYRTAHEATNAGCTESGSPNYDSTALTLDNSCQFYEVIRGQFRKNSSTASDGVRFEGRTVFMRRPIIGDKSEGYYVATIDKVCTASSCSVNGVRPKKVAWTYTTPTFEWTKGSDVNAAKASSKAALETNLTTLETNYVPNCTLTAQPSNQWKTETACDSTLFSIDKTLFTSNCNGNVEKIIYTFSNGETYTWEKSSGITASKFENDTPADTRAGYGGLLDRLKTLKEIQDQTLGSTTETRYVKSGEHTQGVVGSELKQQLFITVRSMDVTTDGCGNQTQGAYQYYGYNYEYPSISLLKPAYDKLDGGLPVVLLDGVVITPTTTFGPFDKSPIYADLLGTVRRGCMDTTAENYDAKANTQTSPTSSKKCIYAEPEEEGGETATNEGSNMLMYVLAAVGIGAVVLM